jgi:hypothetical protein
LANTSSGRTPEAVGEAVDDLHRRAVALQAERVNAERSGLEEAHSRKVLLRVVAHRDVGLLRIGPEEREVLVLVAQLAGQARLHPRGALIR